jgi:RimJ/RimL family protein N-acetyltransferase
MPTETSRNYAFAPKDRTTRRASRAAAGDSSVLPDGTRLRFRPIGSDDRDRLAGLFARLTPESRRRRFLSPKPELTLREIAFLTDIDHVAHEAIAAVDQHDGSIVGVARYVRLARRAGVADVAVAVVDELQSMGLGTELTKRAVERARANGFTLLTATTLWENRPARALLRRVGFRARATYGGEIELELELEPASDRSRTACRDRSPLTALAPEATLTAPHTPSCDLAAQLAPTMTEGTAK